MKKGGMDKGGRGQRNNDVENMKRKWERNGDEKKKEKWLQLLDYVRLEG